MTVCAAVDCGTNSTRLTIADGGDVLHRGLQITRLGEGVHDSNRLKPEAIARTVQALSEFADLMKAKGVERCRAVATSAVRDAVNSDDFLEAASAALGYPVEVIAGDEEARLTFSGATVGLPSLPYLVVDIGGGSTELVLGEGPRLINGVSIDVGAVRLTEMFVTTDPPEPSELYDAFAYVEAKLAEVEHILEVPKHQPELIGVAGTITTLAMLDQGLVTYDPALTHGYVLERDAIEEMFRSMCLQSSAERVEAGVEKGRADIIIAGMVVLLSVMRGWQLDRCRVSETDILQGMLESLS